MINKTLDLGIPEAQETYSSSEHFYSEMNIPASATGRLPRSARTREGLSAERVEDLGETGKNSRGGSGGSPDRGRSSGRGDSGRGGSGRSGGANGGSARSKEGRERPVADRPSSAKGADRPTSAEVGEGVKPRRTRNRRRIRGGQADSAGAGTGAGQA
jgi:hypothetical protein